MEAVQHFFKTIERGAQQLVIDLPEGVDKAEVEVTVRPLYEKIGVLAQNEVPERYHIAQKMKGSMSADYDTDQYDVYDQ